MEEYLPHAFISIGSAIIIFLSYIAIRASKSTGWEKTSGVLLKKGKQLHTSRDIDTKAINWKSIHIDIEYEYEVNGKKYVSKRATFTDMVNKPSSSLDKLLNEYLSSSNIVVYYNPQKHSDSVLLPGVRIWNFTPMVTGALFIAAGVFLLNQ